VLFGRRIGESFERGEEKPDVANGGVDFCVRRDDIEDDTFG
jgi:hypothetical protein